MDLVEWFKTLPLWLDLPEIRVAHACYHPLAARIVAERLGGAHLTPETLHEAIDEGQSPRLRVEGEMTLFEAVEILCEHAQLVSARDSNPGAVIASGEPLRTRA